MKLWRIVLTVMVALWLAPARAHEMWLEPTQFRIDPGAEIVADMRVGMHMNGYQLPYLDAMIDRIGVVDREATRPLPGTMGDIPAIRVQTRAPDLQVLFYQSTAERLGWAEFKKFEDFVTDHGLDWVLDEHRRRGLPDHGFQEAYTRCAKALVQVGEGASGHDVVIGLPAELVAETNPYSLHAGDKLPLRALWHGGPFANAHVRVFRRNGDNLSVTDVVAGADGRVEVPLTGPGVYLLNAVQMSQGSEKPQDVWHSWWASLVFAVAE